MEEMRQKYSCRSDFVVPLVPLYRYLVSIAGRTGVKRDMLAGERSRPKEFQSAIRDSRQMLAYSDIVNGREQAYFNP